MNVPASPRQTSTMAIFSLIFGVLSWCMLPFIGAVVAVVCGHSARAEIRRAPPGSIEGDGMALAGLILDWLHLAFFVLAIVLIFMVFGGLAFFTHFAH